MSAAPPSSPVDAVRPPLAGLARRFAALLYEALLLVALILIAGFVLTPWVSPGSSSAGALMLPSKSGRVVSLLALFVLGAMFFGWCWSDRRRTLPMKTWRLALVTTAGGPLSPRVALIRYVALWIGPALALAAYLLTRSTGLGALVWPLLALNWLAAFVDSDRQFLHDRLAGTRLVSSPV